jgi:2-polyprenyl-3-methyl-5-hydroxy-6-metoxy-1,4-benzoquinol methylase
MRGNKEFSPLSLRERFIYRLSTRKIITMKKSFESEQFQHPLIVGTYNTNNPIDDYKDFCLDFASDVGAKKIVDVGCGTGLMSCAFARKGFEVVGVEPAKPMLEIAKKTNCSKNVKWVHGLAKDLSDYKADLVIMTGHVAQFHITDKEWDEALHGIYQALKPGGYLIFESRNPNLHFWEAGKAQASWQSTKEKPDITNDEVFGEVRSWIEFVHFQDYKLEYKIHYFFVKTGETVVSHDILKFRTQEELSRSLEIKNFKILNVYGFWDKSPVKNDSPEFVFLAQKR